MALDTHTQCTRLQIYMIHIRDALVFCRLLVGLLAVELVLEWPVPSRVSVAVAVRRRLDHWACPARGTAQRGVLPEFALQTPAHQQQRRRSQSPRLSGTVQSGRVPPSSRGLRRHPRPPAH